MEDNDDSFNEESPKPIKQIKRKAKKISDIENDNDFQFKNIVIINLHLITILILMLILLIKFIYL